MLTLTRRSGERIRIGPDVVIIIKEIRGNQIKIGIEAPRSIHVYREELFIKLVETNRAASQTSREDIDRLICEQECGD